MSKLEIARNLPDGGITEKVKTAVELSNLASLTEETRRAMAQGQMAVDRIERTILKAEKLLERLEF
jgi:hypothetical protein